MGSAPVTITHELFTEWTPSRRIAIHGASPKLPCLDHFPLDIDHSPSVARRKTPRPAPTDDPGPGPFHDQAESRKLVTDFIKKAPDPKIKNQFEHV